MNTESETKRKKNMILDSLKLTSKEYQDAHAAFSVAYNAYTAVVMQYRARQVGDDVFLKAQKAFKEAHVAFDIAEANENEKVGAK